MKTLTIRQPWAWAIYWGTKRIENRTWYTSYRGPLLIHAATRRDDVEAAAARDLIIENYGLPVPSLANLTYGAVIGQAILIGVSQRVATEPDEWAEGPECWQFEDDVLVAQNPLAMRGRLGLFEVDDAVVAKLALVLPMKYSGTCRVCGCTDDKCCPGGCYWIEDHLCSACAEK